jgi:predicted alpha/beta hydrolase family esterase
MPPVLIVPGLRDHAPGHWQTLLAASLQAAGHSVRCVLPMGRAELDCAARVDAIEDAAARIGEPAILVAHSAGCLMVAHWARRTQFAVHGALLAAPPDFDVAMPAGYPSLDELSAHGWLPVPRGALPFPSIVGASRNDPLARFERVADLAADWGSRIVDLGAVGHLNPTSGFGHWARAESLIAELAHA